MFSVLMLNTRLSFTKWVSLVLLVFGVALVQFNPKVRHVVLNNSFSPKQQKSNNSIFIIIVADIFCFSDYICIRYCFPCAFWPSVWCRHLRQTRIMRRVFYACYLHVFHPDSRVFILKKFSRYCKSDVSKMQSWMNELTAWLFDPVHMICQL